MSSIPARIPFTQVGAALLPPNQNMTAGQYLNSPSSLYRLLLQSDGNLAIYDITTGALVWVADSNQPYSQTLAPNGESLNLYVSNSAFLSDPLNRRLWIAETGDASDLGLWTRSHLSLQDDANLVILDIKALWASNTSIPFTPGATEARVLNPGVSMEVGRFYTAGAYSLVFQGDGNLVVYTPDLSPVWFSGTANVGATQAVMQGDGNFVISNTTGQPIWYTGTGGYPGAYAQIQNNGNFVVSYERPLWARFGFTPVRVSRQVYQEYVISHTWDLSI